MPGPFGVGSGAGGGGGGFPGPGAIAATTGQIVQPPRPPSRGFFPDFGRGFTSNAGPFQLENPNFASVLGQILGNTQMQIGGFGFQGPNTAGGQQARLMQQLMKLLSQPQATNRGSSTLRVGGNTAAIDATSMVP